MCPTADHLNAVQQRAPVASAPLPLGGGVASASEYLFSGIDPLPPIEKTGPRLQFMDIVRRPSPPRRPDRGPSEQSTTKNRSAT